jgi:hypothetical protein
MKARSIMVALRVRSRKSIILRFGVSRLWKINDGWRKDGVNVEGAAGGARVDATDSAIPRRAVAKVLRL